MFDTPSAGSSPVPAGYGSLGGGLPREHVERPLRSPRERKPFRWKVWREDSDDSGGPPGVSSRAAPETTAPAPETTSRPRRAPSAPTSRSGTVTLAPRPVAPVASVASPPVRRSRVVLPAVPRQPVGTDGRIVASSASSPPEPEPRPAAYLKETIRTRQVIRHVDTRTVVRVSLLFYVLGVVVLLLAGVLLWNVATALGTITSIDKSIKTLFDLKAFTLRPLPVLGYGAAFGVVVVIFGTLVNVLASVFFNLISDVTGGVAVRVVAQPDDE